MDDLIQVLRMLVSETDVLGMADPADADERERLAVAVIRECTAVAGIPTGRERFATARGIPRHWHPAARLRLAGLLAARENANDRPHAPAIPRRFARIGGAYVRMIAV